jgi:RNA polymerase sigma-70 factor, ECF subfamily
VVRNPAHAEEVAQEAYLDAWRSSTRYDAARGSAVGWLLTIVHRKAVDRIRSVEAATSRDETWNREAAPTDHDQTSEAAHASLDAARVRGAVATLTDVQRQAVELTYFGGYTHTEVATLLDVPLGTAKTRIRDGLIRLRDLMGVAS